jgi:hypothetical protein
MKQQSPERTRARKTNTTLQVIALKTLLTHIDKRPSTQPEIMEVTGLCNSTVSRWLKVLHTSPKAVYISGWKRTGSRGNYSAVWAAGYGMADTPKPKPLTNAEYLRNYRKKHGRASRISTDAESGIVKHSAD